MFRYTALLLALLVMGCQPSPEDFYRQGDEMEAASKHKKVSRTFSDFVNSPHYRHSRDFWRGGSINQYNPLNSRVEILLNEQRGRLYINDLIAMDFPVCTGVAGETETPRGTFFISEKKPEHRSTLYGSFVDAQGNTIESSVHSSDIPPAGTRFEGTLMPYWMRFNGAIGMHTGRIERYGLSHGCVRVPEEACSILYEKLEVGSQVIVK